MIGPADIILVSYWLKVRVHVTTSVSVHKEHIPAQSLNVAPVGQAQARWGQDAPELVVESGLGRKPGFSQLRKYIL